MLTATKKLQSNTNQVEDTEMILSKFLDEYKKLFNQLLQENSMILNMLTVLIIKIIYNRLVSEKNPMEYK